MRHSTEIAQYDFPTTIVYGRGVRDRIKPALEAAGFKRPLIVTDEALAELPPVQLTKDALKGLDFAVYSGVVGNPTKSQVEAGAKSYKEHKADCLIAVGGGAPVDVAKAIAVAVSHEGDLLDYAIGASPQKLIDGELPYIAALPTTAGTGSEVGRSTMISDDKTHVKYVISSPKMLPAFVAADPDLHLALPQKITAATGIDALTHLVEAYLAKDFQPICDGIALHGIRIVSKWIKPAYDWSAKPTDTSEAHATARGMMLNASMMGAIAFQKGLGLTHSCAHALSAVCDLHHGLANGIMIDYCMEFNRSAAPEEFREMAQAAGLKNQTPEGFVQWLKDLKADLDIPAKLNDVGVTKEHIPALVGVSLQDICHPLGPRTVTQADFERIFNEAID